MREFPSVLGGRLISSGQAVEVRNPYDGAPVGRTWLAGDAEFESAVHN